MKTLGFLLIGTGVGLILFSLTMNVAVDGGADFGPMANNDLMNQRLIYAVIGSASVVSGFISLAIKAINRISP
ncbi:hypothetical protein [Brevundimonas sp.]|uniref:hypothetical protein n=1 Tax=Brevundimonas sp. TaxID=1871086 RepID=UPI0028A1EB34|nr:hypothetical protein [Brevundimonas sp.]